MKERIIGAAVLVALAVLVVPVFLDGPPDNSEVRSERVPLPGQDEQKSQTVVLERNRSEPVPAQPAADKPADPPPDATLAAEQPPARATGVAEEKAPESAPDGTQLAEADVPATVTPPATTAVTRETPPARVSARPAATGMFAVQLGSFSSKANAEKLAADLRKQGFAAFLSQLDRNGKALHRVRVGPQKDRQAAESMAARLAQAGHKGQVVPHP